MTLRVHRPTPPLRAQSPLARMALPLGSLNWRPPVAGVAPASGRSLRTAVFPLTAPPGGGSHLKVLEDPRLGLLAIASVAKPGAASRA